MTIPFQWQGDDDDATCRYGHYLLRAECMDVNLYWWAVCRGEEQIGTGYADGMPEAMQKAEQTVREL